MFQKTKSRLKKWHFVAPSVLVSIVAVAFFSAGPSVPMDNDQTSALALAEKKAESADESSAQFGEDISVDNLVITISEPESFEVLDSFIDTTDKYPNRIIASIQNNGEKPFEAYSFSLGTPIIDDDPDAFCEQLFPMQDDIPAVPDDLVIKKGEKLTFHWIYMCEANVGDSVSLNITVTDTKLLAFKSTIK